MNNELTNEIKAIGSIEVAEMTAIPHKDLLKKIRKYCTVLAEGKISLTDFFIESSYRDKQNQVRPAYMITKKGCDMVANKMTGERGILFTAAYVNKFDEMEKKLKATTQGIPALPQNYKEALLALVAAEEEKEKLQEAIAVQLPKVTYHDTVLQADKLVTMTDVAKDIGMSAMKLHSILNDLGVIYKQSKVWKPYANYQFLIPEYMDYHITEYSQTLKVNEKGRKWIIDLLKSKGKI